MCSSLSVLHFLFLFCCSLSSLSWFTVFFVFFKLGTSWETHVHIRETFFIIFCSYCDPSIHKHTARSLGELPLSRQNLLQRLRGEGGGQEWVWGWRSTQGGFFEGKQGDDEDSMCLQRGLSVGSVVEYEESEQALNLTVTLKVLKQQSFKKCWVSSGLVLITWKQRETRVKLEQGPKQIRQITVNM